MKSEKEQWKEMWNQTMALVNEDPSFLNLSPKEKLLTFNYYHIDTLMDYRFFLGQRLVKPMNPLSFYSQTLSYKRKFSSFIEDIVDEATDKRLLKSFPGYRLAYQKFFWLQHLFFLRYWVTDSSEDKDHTTAIIEKAMKSTFDFAGKGSIQSSVDFWKFFAQNPFTFTFNYE